MSGGWARISLAMDYANPGGTPPICVGMFEPYLLHPSIRGKGLAFDDADGGQWSHEFGVE